MFRLASISVTPMVLRGGSAVAIARQSVVAVRHFADHSVATWSPNQVKRQDKMKGPRFVDIELSKQPLPKPAIDMIAKQPVIEVDSRVAVCDGGHAGLGHPRVYINLDDPAAPSDCGYCGQKFTQKHHHH